MTVTVDTRVKRRRSTSPESAPVWAAAWRTDESASSPVPAPRVAHLTPTACAPPAASRGAWRDRLWLVFGVLSVVLPMLGLVLVAWTGQELWLLPAAAVAAVVAVALTIWT